MYHFNHQILTKPWPKSKITLTWIVWGQLLMPFRISFNIFGRYWQCCLLNWSEICPYWSFVQRCFWEKLHLGKCGDFINRVNNRKHGLWRKQVLLRCFFWVNRDSGLEHNWVMSITHIQKDSLKNCSSFITSDKDLKQPCIDTFSKNGGNYGEVTVWNFPTR